MWRPRPSAGARCSIAAYVASGANAIRGNTGAEFGSLLDKLVSLTLDAGGANPTPLTIVVTSFTQLRDRNSIIQLERGVLMSLWKAGLIGLVAAAALWASSITSGQQRVVTVVIDGGGSTIATGDTKFYPSAKFGCTINQAMISADQTGSITVDVWKVNAAIPTGTNKISASAPVTLATAQLNQASSLTGWSLGVLPNDVFGFNVATATTVTRVTVQLWCQ